MTTTTIRVRPDTRDRLASIAKREGQPIAEVVARLVAEHEANTMLDRHVAVVTRLGAGVSERADVEEEQRQLDGTLLDGLEDDPWPLDGRGQPAR
jgi:predicted DNA-binding protein